VKRLLVVDDEKNAREGLAAALGVRYAVTTAAGGGEAIQLLREGQAPFDLVLTDLRMVGKSGLDVVAHCRSLRPPPLCILMTAYGDIATAVQAMKAGATDFLPKPLDLDAVEATLRRLLKESAPEEQSLDDGNGPPIVGPSAAMERTLALIRRVAPTEATVLLTGETGVGKELLAREIHRLSPRSGGPFLAVNGAALPGDMVESVLFGHERGAFTDAHRQHIGYFERASGGTFLLDEVGELPPGVQVKLLRVLETRTFERLGGQQTLSTNIRLVAATNAPLEELVRTGRFRGDLYYRLCVVPIAVPALRERTEDIPVLLNFFLGKHRQPPVLSREVLRLLCRYPWPGNVRELRNFCDSMAALHGGETICPGQLDGRFLGILPPSGNSQSAIPLGDGGSGPSELLRALESANGNHSRAAQSLGISRSTFYRRLRREGSRD
jgi:DNA-binding NtrC family response regulator